MEDIETKTSKDYKTDLAYDLSGEFYYVSDQTMN